MTTETRSVILGVAASDAHAVANHLIAGRLRYAGFAVENLGVCTPLEEFAEALERSPHSIAIVIGSLNGHAYEDLRSLPQLRAEGRLDRPVILGGNLSVGSRKSNESLELLRGLGVDVILDDPDKLPFVLDSLCRPQLVDAQ